MNINKLSLQYNGRMQQYPLFMPQATWETSDHLGYKGMVLDTYTECALFDRLRDLSNLS